MVPPPPGLFSTMAVWLRRACNPVAISRATTSLEPPGVNGTMMRMVLLGKLWAQADEIKPRTMTQAASSCAMVSPICAQEKHNSLRGHLA